MGEPRRRTPKEPLRGGLTVVRLATTADAGLLAAWHADPEVSRYWDDETPGRDEVLERLADPDVDSYVVEAGGGEPVGFLQAWFDGESGEAGLDMFLAPSARGGGLGPDAARTLARFLLDEVGRARVTVDPYLWNEAGIRAWQRAGFRPLEEREPDDWHREAWLLMAFVDESPPSA